MKKKQLAVILGMSIMMTTFSSLGAYASATDTSNSSAVTDATAPEDETEETEEETEETEEAKTPEGQPPEKPDGEMPQGQGGPGGDGQAPDGQPPEMPNGEMPQGQGGPGGNGQMPDGQPPEMPNGEMPQGQGGPGEMNGGPGGMSQGVESYEALTEYTEDAETSGETYASMGTDENAILVSEGATAQVSDATITRESSDSTGGDNASFYGVGAAVLATDGTAVVSGSTITTDAKGGAGAFAYGDGTVYISDTTIETSQDTSGGIHAAGGGTLYAWDLDVTTQGGSSAAIRSDRGGGTMVVDGGSYTSNGSGSPAIYSTADIAVNNADLTATGSEAICIEGRNSIHLFDCDLTGAMPDQDQNDNTWNVILYQSMSGDSEVGNSTFEMVGGTLTAENGGMFYTTNTESTFILNGVDITYAEDSEFFLQCTGNTNARGWGSSGSNGADCLFTAIAQEMQGDIIWDSISTLDLYMTEGSVLTGAIIDDETWAGNGGNGTCTVTISEDSAWVVTGDSQLTSLYNAGTITDEEGNAVTIIGTDGTVYVEGTSAYTVTVGSYDTTADLSGAAQTGSWSDYEVSAYEA